VVFREIDRIRVKGKEEAIVIHEPLEKESAELESWGEALRACRARQWDAAEAVLQRLRHADPACGLYGAYLRKVHPMRRDPPPSDWDGITKFDKK
jgi:adenylate cyclase